MLWMHYARDPVKQELSFTPNSEEWTGCQWLTLYLMTGATKACLLHADHQCQFTHNATIHTQFQLETMELPENL